MKKYRPNTTAVVIGIVLMVIGLLLWVLRAIFNNNAINFFIPVGLLLVCAGGLDLTITAFITLRKNDLATRKYMQEKENTEKMIKSK